MLLQLTSCIPPLGFEHNKLLQIMTGLYSFVLAKMHRLNSKSYLDCWIERYANDCIFLLRKEIGCIVDRESYGAN